LTSFARSFKEAQVYLIPLMVLSLTPGLLSLMPGLAFSGLLAATPLINVVLLARDIFQGAVDPVLAGVAVASTVLYALAAIAAAARVFGGDAIVCGSRGVWSDLFRRPTRPSSAPSMATASFCLALIFPAYFLLGSLLAHSQQAGLSARLAAASLIAIVVLGAFPWAVAVYNRIRMRECFGLRGASPRVLFAAIVLGLSLWPFAHELFLANEMLGLTPIDVEIFASAERLLDELSRVPLAYLLITLAVVPALFEEFFFRGFLFAALRGRVGPTGTVLLSAALFGLFHVAAPTILAVERLLPSTLLGIALGWVRYRAGALLPAILLHACHNGFLLTLAHFRDDLAAFSLGLQGQKHLPLTWLIAAAVLVAAATALLLSADRTIAGVRKWRDRGALGADS
jgi:ABC-2 type transport system permease protein/sodium transport system permease protein